MSRRRKAQEIVTGYSGPFSSFSEWHAFGTGFYYGANTEYSKIPDDLWNPDAYRYNRDVEREPHYAHIGFLLGDFYRRHRRGCQVGGVGLLGLAATVLSQVL